ncbi:rhamnulokinase family protein [Acidipila sp. EB88]|uniref:rhamnulokinase n=1 Tax=Acidipila sp. EB88 TaxID=2305226 RepID=UPI000F5DFE6D|nr:FGGY-family carbohydrate kinase [Acidipila sp. EB88]RRA49186.1 carbohydrate kinase [Acidipila sp. EB88]
MSAHAASQATADRRGLIAVDLGAESCRVSLLQWVDGEPHMRLVHRFANGPVPALDGSLRWPLERILEGVDAGVRIAAALAPVGIRSIAVDGWAVDYVRLEEDGRLPEDPYCYRDLRNVAAATALHAQIAPGRIREITGTEQQPINTLYQLYADRLSGRAPARWLNLPEYLLHRWGAEPVAEYTNASHTQLIDLSSRRWSEELFDAAGLDETKAARIVPAGTLLGKLSGALASVPELSDTDLVAPACHDTASAIAGISEAGEDWAYISCGTWSLVGAVIAAPLNSAAVRADNFTNLGAVGGRCCFHKGINGMWVLKQCMDHWAQEGEPWDIGALVEAAACEHPPEGLLSIDDPELMRMGRMPERIAAQCIAHGLPLLSQQSKDAPKMVSLILHSLAAQYAHVIERVRIHTGKKLERVVMVGGGAQNALLRQLTSETTRAEIITGPQESSTVGNLAVQCALRDGATPASPDEFARAVRFWASRIAHVEPRAAAHRMSHA